MPTQYKLVLSNGQEFNSIAAACRAFNVPLNHYRRKLQRGWTPEEIFGIVSNRFAVRDCFVPRFHQIYCITHLESGRRYVGQTAQRVEDRWREHCGSALSGKRASTLHTAIKKYGVEAFSIEVLESGVEFDFVAEREDHFIMLYRTLEPEFGFNLMRGGGTGGLYQDEIEFRGRKFSSMKHLAQHYGVPYHKVHKRINSGWSMEQALDMVEKPKRTSVNKKEIVLSDGNSFLSFSSFAKEYGIDVREVSAKIQSGWTPEQIIGREPKPKWSTADIEVVLHTGERFKTLSEAARYFGLEPMMVQQRVRKGFTIEQALNLAERKRKSPRSQRIFFREEWFESNAALARHYGIDNRVLSKRLKKGYPLSVALGIDIA